MAEVVHLKTVIQFRRGLSSEWESLNPILRLGEPGYAVDTNVLKIGNGETSWKDLSPIGGAGSSETNKLVVNCDTHYDFPSIGSVNVIYKAYQEQMLYQWNETEMKYEPLSSTTVDINSVSLINGGNANGTNT